MRTARCSARPSAPTRSPRRVPAGPSRTPSCAGRWGGGAREVLEQLDARRADGIGLTGQMHGLVALGADDRPLRPAILWNDGRAQRECEQIEERIGVARLIELGGNRALAGFTAPKLLWMAEHEPALHARIRRVLLPKDYVRLRLCGEH